MTENGLTVDTVKIINHLQQAGVDKYVVLMRHAARHFGAAESDPSMGLTEGGKQAAIEFGQGLPPEPPVRFFSSYIERCVETSVLIEQGLLSKGGTTKTNKIIDPLYVFFVNDLSKLNQIAYKMIGEDEWPQFVRNWFDGKISTELIDDAAQAAQTLLNSLLELLQEPSAYGGNICISHDWNLFLIKEFYLGLKPEDNEYIQFLEGVIIYEMHDAFYIINHQSEAKMLKLL